jgi:hypothetical protein
MVTAGTGGVAGMASSSHGCEDCLSEWGPSRGSLC